METTKVKDYGITEEHCWTLIKGVCRQCGGKLSPVETVDNSGAPTFWPHCPNCSVFEYGVNKTLYEICRKLVDDKGYISYDHIEQPDKNSKQSYREYYRHSQIGGAFSIVVKVLSALKETKDEFDIREQARQYAESCMPNNWDRNNRIQIPIFYGHMVDFLMSRIMKLF